MSCFRDDRCRRGYDREEGRSRRGGDRCRDREGGREEEKWCPRENERCCHDYDHGPKVYAVDVQKAAKENECFRTALWTGCYGQMTLMSIPVCGEIGVEIHPDTDQIISVEQGKCIVKVGKCKGDMCIYNALCQGMTVFIPAGTWHNIINIGRCSLKLSSIYAPPHHPWGTVRPTKEDAEAAAECE